jgi:hypothetical protein
VLPENPGQPTLNVTEAYQTVEARLTEALAMTPTPDRTPTIQETHAETAMPTTPPAALTPTPTRQPSPTPTATPLCDQAAPGNPIDVTIPDDTRLEPGQSFTKTWRLQNVGTCTWDETYAMVWFSGEKFGSTLSVPLRGNVPPGATVDLSVDMVAPEAPGTYQSHWKLRNTAGVLFGIGPSGGSSYWVRIEVIELPTVTPSPTIPSPAPPTPTPTAEIRASGPAALQINDLLDLDENQLNPPEGGEDLIFLLRDGFYLLQPTGSAMLAVFGTTQPTLLECQTQTLSADPVVMDNLLTGTYLCYRTNMALPGWARFVNLNTETNLLELEIRTWAIP